MRADEDGEKSGDVSPTLAHQTGTRCCPNGGRPGVQRSRGVLAAVPSRPVCMLGWPGGHLAPGDAKSTPEARVPDALGTPWERLVWMMRTCSQDPEG